MTGTTTLEAAFAARYGHGPERPLAAVEGADRLLGLLGRRSCRGFRPDPTPDDLLTLLLACAQSAPSKSDLQQYAILVVDDPELRAAIHRLPSLPRWVADAPRLLVFCADARRGRRIAELKGLTYAADGVDTLVNAVGDAAIALMAFVHAAETVGLGCCPLSVVRNHIREVSDLLGLPAGVFPFAGLCVGYPRTKSDAGVSLRLPQSAVVHRNRYDDAALEQHLAAYDDRRHEAAPIPPEKQLHPDRYGLKEGLRWSDNVARRLSVRERPHFRRYLAEQGLDLG